MQEKNYGFWYGFLASNLFALLAMALVKFVNDHKTEGADYGAIMGTGFFVIIPVLMGIICAYFWRNLNIKTGMRLLYMFIVFLLTLVLTTYYMREGMVCLIIVMPLVYVFQLVGLTIGYYMFRKKKKNNNTLNMSIISILVAYFVIDILNPQTFEKMVGDTIVINAPPAEVWNYVVAYEPIEAEPEYWLFRIGMPRPVQSTVSGYKVGESRKCIFNNGYVFDEVMTVFEPEKDLTFDITHQPRDPEIMGHIDILRGQFLLKDNGDGTTTLTGNSWYKLYVFPAWYYNIWAESITRNVHLSVMKHIKVLCEKENK